MRKILLAALLVVLVLVVAALIAGHFTLAPTGEVSDSALPEAVDDALLTYFEEDYASSRAAFLAFLPGFRGRYQGVEAGALKVPSQDSDDLTIDWIYIPAQGTPRRVMILCSGIHGAEAPAGTAVLRQFMDQVLPSADLDELSVLLVHALNPYGFAHMRRVSENNVDLNRNFDVSPSLFEQKNPGYTAVSDTINPRGPVDLGSFTHRLYAERAVYHIVSNGMAALRQAILYGQYEHPKGVYFGGTAFEPQRALLEPLFKRVMADQEAILLIDLHTGYGIRGVLHLYPNVPANDRIFADTEAVFAGHHIDWPQKDDSFYRIRGDFTDWVGRLVDLDRQRWIPMAFEYGTLDSQTTAGAIDSLHRTVLENQGYHYGYASPADRTEVERRYREMFFPSSPRWRSKILRDTAALWPGMLERFAAL